MSTRRSVWPIGTRVRITAETFAKLCEEGKVDPNETDPDKWSYFNQDHAATVEKLLGDKSYFGWDTYVRFDGDDFLTPMSADELEEVPNVATSG